MTPKNNEVKCVTSIFTIFFEYPFWVGILEENYDEKNYMGKYIFGAEPSNSELIQFYLYEFDKKKKIKISESKSGLKVEARKMSFKKSLNKSKKIQNKKGVGTKSQNLFQKAFEETMGIKKKAGKAEERLDKEEKYLKKQEKKLEKSKGH
jgi:hypothetical protein